MLQNGCDELVERAYTRLAGREDRQAVAVWVERQTLLLLRVYAQFHHVEGLITVLQFIRRLGLPWTQEMLELVSAATAQTQCVRTHKSYILSVFIIR